MRAGRFPRVTTSWFFKAGTFFIVAQYLDEVHSPAADFLSWNHDEGFVRFFEDRMSRQGIYSMDEPECALLPKRQLEFLRILSVVQEKAKSQTILATNSPILMSFPRARVLEVTRQGIRGSDYHDTKHLELNQSFTVDYEDQSQI